MASVWFQARKAKQSSLPGRIERSVITYQITKTYSILGGLASGFYYDLWKAHDFVMRIYNRFKERKQKNEHNLKERLHEKKTNMGCTFSGRAYCSLNIFLYVLYDEC
jgi:hypothetical protein